MATIYRRTLSMTAYRRGTHYETLDIRPDATKDQVKVRNFRRYTIWVLIYRNTLGRLLRGALLAKVYFLLAHLSVQLSKTHHPDIPGHKVNPEFHEITEAYNVLRDPISR